MKILHLIVDHQVIERTLGIYDEVFPLCNDVLVFDWKPKDPIKHLTTHKNSPIVRHDGGLAYGRTFDFSGITHIIAHYLTMDMIDFIKSAPPDIHICWEIYGADLYNQFLIDYGYNIYYSSPKKYSKYSFLETYFNPVFMALLYLKGVKYVYPSQRRKQFDYIINRVNSLQYCCKYDARLVEKYAQRSIHSYEIFNYSLSDVLSELKGYDFFDGKDIMIGNSASLSNNHFYILKFLKNIILPKDANIIMPLSYGGCQSYINDVISKYSSELSNNIIVYRDYMPLHEYNKTFTRLRAMVLSAWRQESQGTAIMGFYLGIKVFMSKKSPLYKWFKDCDFIVYPIEDSHKEDLATPLKYEEKVHNREIVLQRYDDNVFSQTLIKNIV